MLVFGGHDNAGRVISSLERYDASTNEWEEEAVAPMPTARTRPGMAVLDGKLYVAGGVSEADGATSNLVERYDLAANAWEEVAPMAEARHAHGVAVLDGKLYALGRRGALGWVERYDPATNA